MSKLEFDYKKRKNPINEFLLRLGLSLLYLIILIPFYDVFVTFDNIYFFSLCLFLFSVYTIDFIKIIFYKKKKGNKALILSEQNIYIQFNNIQVDWKDVQDVNYIIKMISSYLLVDLKDETAFIRKQKWYKRPRLYLNNWKFKTPLVFNLENIKGESDENYKKIKNFIKVHNLLPYPQ